MEDITVEDFKLIVSKLLNKKAWNVKIGHGSFLTMNFGEPKSDVENRGKVFGEWYLWLYLSPWRIEGNSELLVGSEDERERLISVESKLEDAVLEKFDIINPYLDAELYFDNGLILRTFSVISGDEDGDSQHWMLFMPENEIISAGPGGSLRLGLSNVAE